MARKKQQADPSSRLGAIASLVQQARLTWRLLRDRRVAIWIKAIIPATLVYLISPIDLIPDTLLGLGQLDDLTILLLGAKLFVDLSPASVVRQHLEELSSIKAKHRVVDQEPDADEPADGPPDYVETSYRVLDDPDKPPRSR